MVGLQILHLLSESLRLLLPNKHVSINRCQCSRVAAVALAVKSHQVHDFCCPNNSTLFHQWCRIVLPLPVMYVLSSVACTGCTTCSNMFSVGLQLLETLDTRVVRLFPYCVPVNHRSSPPPISKPWGYAWRRSPPLLRAAWLVEHQAYRGDDAADTRRQVTGTAATTRHFSRHA